MRKYNNKKVNVQKSDEYKVKQNSYNKAWFSWKIKHTYKCALMNALD